MNTVIILTIFVNLYGCIPSGTTLRCNYFEDKTFNIHANCSNRNLTNIPTVASNVVALNLSCNRIKVVENKTFLYLKVLRELNLSYNELEWLDQGAFLGLKNVQSLILRKNQLAYNSEHFANSIFKPLKSLTYLDLTLQRLDSTKMKTSWFSKYVISDLTNLHSIGIDIVASATDYIFREGFLSLTKLTAVKSGFCCINGNAKAFGNISRVDTIDLTDCNIQAYAVGTLSGRKLKYLNLRSTNPLPKNWLKNFAGFQNIFRSYPFFNRYSDGFSGILG